MKVKRFLLQTFTRWRFGAIDYFDTSQSLVLTAHSADVSTELSERLQ